MTTPTARFRSLLTHAALAAAPIAGVTFLLNAPLRQEYADAQARLSLLRFAIDNADPDALPTATLADMIRSLGANAESSPTIYDAITAAASRNAVRVDAISPSTPPAQDEEDAVPHETYAFSIVAFGTFENLLPFIAELERECGFTSIREVQIEPARSAAPGMLQASIETVHVRYTLSVGSRAEEDGQ